MEYIKNAELCSNDFDASYINTILDIIFNKCPEGIAYKDKNLKYMAANDAFYKIFMTNKEETIGFKQLNGLSEQNIKLVNDVNKNIAEEMRSANYVLNCDIGKKQDKILNISSTPITYGNEFLGIVTIVKDITDEESIKEKFVLKHFQLKSLLENIPMLIYMQDKNLNFIAGTTHSRDFISFGYDVFSDINIDKKEYAKGDDADGLDVIKNNKVYSKERELIDTKGTLHWYKIYKVPITDFNDDVTGIITVIKNIDAEKQLQVQRETFVASIGHDLKNPTIAQIRGLELLLKGNFGEMSSEQRNLIEMVLDSCRYMNGMLSSLLATYRNYGGSTKLNFKNFSLVELVMECVSEMIYVAKDKDVKISVDNASVIEFISGDRVQIKRVIMNLLSNGIKYAFKSTTLKIFLKDCRNFIKFEFENESPYIPTEKQKSIFARYVSYASAHKELGIGLGLYASKKIIDAHNGEIYVKSYEDNRNLFGFKIPVKQNSLPKEREIYF